MNDSDTVETLVIRHLSDVESAIRYLESKLEPRFFRAVAGRMEDWASQHGWVGKFDPESDTEFWMGPLSWRTVDGGDDDERDITELASFVGASARGNRRALVFNRIIPKGKRVWQAVLGENDAILQQLRELGFDTDTSAGVISHLVELDARLLGQALVDEDFNDVLAPLATALDKVGLALPCFEKLAFAARAA